MSEPCVLVDATDPAVIVLTLNRPSKRNAMNVQLLEELHAAIQSASENADRRVLILCANGPAFCAGMDLREAADRANTEGSSRALAAAYLSLVSCPLVTIAAAQGAAIGGGVGLLSACDVVIAGDDLQITLPEVRRGLVAALVTALVRRQMNDRTLRDLILLGQTISVKQALSIGFINQIVPFEQLMAAARETAALALQSAPLAVAHTKKLLDELSPRPIAQELERALRYHLEARDSADAIEGIAAFFEKRKPRWSPPE